MTKRWSFRGPAEHAKLADGLISRYRAVRKFQKKDSSVAKLVRKGFFYQRDQTAANRIQFAKHFKLEEQVSFLQKSRTGIAVGTPQRLIDLIENGTAHG